MSLTSQDLQAIGSLIDQKMDEKLTIQTKTILETVDKRMDQKLAILTKELSVVINQALSTVDDMYATKAEVAEVRQRVSQIERTLAVG